MEQVFVLLLGTPLRHIRVLQLGLQVVFRQRKHHLHDQLELLADHEGFVVFLVYDLLHYLQNLRQLRLRADVPLIALRLVVGRAYLQDVLDFVDCQTQVLALRFGQVRDA